MKVHYLPEKQEARNDAIIRKLRRLSATVWLLLLGSVVSASVLYIRGPVVPGVPLLMNADTNGVLADALLIAPDYVLGFGDLPQPAVLTFGHERLSVRKVRTVSIGEATFTLFRLEGEASTSPLTPTVAAVGDRLVAEREGVGWEGVVTGLEDTEILVEPDLSVPAGASVFSRDDPTALAGVTVSKHGGVSVLPIVTILENLAELGGAR